VQRHGQDDVAALADRLDAARSRQGALARRRRDARAGIAYVPESRGIFANLSVRENLVMAARRCRNGSSTWNLARVLATFPRLAHGGGQLSGGDQQMLTIGRALMTNPELIILDEATEGLAPLVRRDIWRVIGDIRQAGVAVVIVDKDHATVNALADRSVVLVEGRAVFAGRQRIAPAPRHPAPSYRGVRRACGGSRSLGQLVPAEDLGLDRKMT
jgi:ABC-type branched-subunit amino acid transport system ATPase component